jgi:hypothetical protein
MKKTSRDIVVGNGNNERGIKAGPRNRERAGEGDRSELNEVRGEYNKANNSQR